MKNLRYLRKRKKLSMKELGLIFGLSESTISLYETGKRQPDNEMLVKIAEYFNVSIDYLIGHEGKNYNGDVLYTDDELKLIENYRLLSRDSQLQLIGYMKALLQIQGMSSITILEENRANLKK